MIPLSRLTCLSIALGLSAVSPAMAGLVPMPGATFGGAGIPNDAVAVTEYSQSWVGITLGLTAHQRYSNPPLANNDVDTFYALPGTGTDLAHATPGYAQWNFAFHVGFAPASIGADLWYGLGNSISLYYDLNPAVGSGATTGGVIPVAAFTGGVFQNSWNLGMPFLSGGTFDPSATGEYEFRLVVNESGNPVAAAAIKVVVANPSAVPDGSSTLILSGLALIAMTAVKRRRRG